MLSWFSWRSVPSKVNSVSPTERFSFLPSSGALTKRGGEYADRMSTRRRYVFGRRRTSGNVTSVEGAERTGQGGLFVRSFCVWCFVFLRKKKQQSKLFPRTNAVHHIGRSSAAWKKHFKSMQNHSGKKKKMWQTIKKTSRKKDSKTSAEKIKGYSGRQSNGQAGRQGTKSQTFGRINAPNQFETKRKHVLTRGRVVAPPVLFISLIQCVGLSLLGSGHGGGRYRMMQAGNTRRRQ